ncbi:MAG: protein kinase [Deltaproteobacteria bacterium]|nr:protein kinase [Deltaproteobacteria bacterium]
MTRGPMADLPEGFVVGGRYVIERPIGRGGFGFVYRAAHTATGQHVAIKILARSTDPVAVKRFLQEARITAGLKHANTVRVFDVGEDEGGFLYLAMELLTGRSLRTALQERLAAGTVFTEREAIEIGTEVSRSLGEAHAAGLVHRDLKLDNIFLHEVTGDDRPIIKVLDFGIAKLADSTITLDSDSGALGTPLYMSPEQAERQDVDLRSDLYSLGIVLFALVAGDVPFRGVNAMATMYRHVHEPAPSLLGIAKTHVSARFARLIATLLEKRPEDRPPSAKAMRDALAACLAPDGADLVTEPRAPSIPIIRGVPSVPARVEATGESSNPSLLTQPMDSGRTKWVALGASLTGVAFAVTVLVSVLRTEPITTAQPSVDASVAVGRLQPGGTVQVVVPSPASNSLAQIETADATSTAPLDSSLTPAADAGVESLRAPTLDAGRARVSPRPPVHKSSPPSDEPAPTSESRDAGGKSALEVKI